LGVSSELLIAGDVLRRFDSNHGKFSVIVAGAAFGRASYSTAIAELQVGSGARVLDLTATTDVDADLFTDLVNTWRCSSGQISHIAVMLPFERWAVLRRGATPARLALAVLGVDLKLFYEEQGRFAPLLWLEGGFIRHNVEKVLRNLETATPLETWPIVIDAVAELVRGETSPPEAGHHLAVVAGLAYRGNDPRLCEPIAREALTLVGAAASPARALALRVLACSLLAQGHDDEAGLLLELAIDTAELCRCPRELAAALCHDGRRQTTRGDLSAARQRFERALATLESHQVGSELTAVAHHGLAVVALREGLLVEAECHAEQALRRWRDPEGFLAAETRGVLAVVREHLPPSN
jgi:hypothetical protein